MAGREMLRVRFKKNLTMQVLNTKVVLPSNGHDSQGTTCLSQQIYAKHIKDTIRRLLT